MTDDPWLTDHLLGESDPTQHEHAERRIAADPTLRQHATQLTEVITRLQALPSAAWVALQTPPDHPDQPTAPPISITPVDSPDRTHRRRAALVLALVVVFGVGLGVGALVRSAGSPQSIRRSIALRPVAGSSRARGVVTLNRTGRLRLSVSHLPSTPPGEFYEAWLMTSPTRLVTLAAFRVSATGHASIGLTPPTSVTRYRYIDISLQHTSAGPAHSKDSVLRGPTAP